MSSFISIIVIITLLLGNASVTPGSLIQILSGDLKFKVETKLNKPLDDMLAEELNELVNICAEFDITYKLKKDMKKLEMQCDMQFLDEEDESFKATYWINQDLSDRNIPKALIIMKHKDDKYNVINIQSPVVDKRMSVVGLFGGLLNAETINAIGTGIADSLKESGARLTEKDGAYTAVLDEDTVKKLIRGIALEAGGYFAPAFFGVKITTDADKNATDNETSSQIDAEINKFFDKLDGVKLFDNNALVFNMTLDDKKQPKNINYSININTNAVELATAFGNSVDDGLTKDKANIDMTVSFDYSYRRINEDITIEYPQINEENSVDVIGGATHPNIDVNAVNVVCNDVLTQLRNKPFIKDGTVYVPLREVLNVQGVDNKNIIWENGTIKITKQDMTAILKTDSDEITMNEEIFNAGENVLLLGETTYIPAAIMEKLNIGSVTNTFYNDDNEIIGCVISVYKYMLQEPKIRFLVSEDTEPMWEKYLYRACDEAGVNVEVVKTASDSFIERTNLVIASGDPMIIIGKYNEVLINKLTEQGAIYPPIKINEDYTAIIPTSIKNPDIVKEILNKFTELIDKFTDVR